MFYTTGFCTFKKKKIRSPGTQKIYFCFKEGLPCHGKAFKSNPPLPCILDFKRRLCSILYYWNKASQAWVTFHKCLVCSVLWNFKHVVAAWCDDLMGLKTRSRFANLCVYSAETTGNFHLVVLLKLVFLDKLLGQDHFLATFGEREK